ncbi:MAG: 3-phosphoglycerate dehydrogenase [Clostridia bacterium]|nr:3-phosphoglycerate dehydrogenase [Clostridia bacterium]
MKNIKLLNKISKVGLDQFSDDYALSTDIENPDAIMVRSAAMHDMEFKDNLLAIARCGAGVNNIPIDDCAKKGIVVFNTPGANANGVKELTIAALLLASRNIIGGVEWANTLTENVAKSVEAGKSAFAGCEVYGKTLGVIGLGAIGGLVANVARHMGMKVLGCDPYITVEGAWHLSKDIAQAKTYEEIYKTADYITLHVPATPTTKNMINAETLAMMKDGVKIINLARADLVNAADLKAAIESGKVSAYVTDFPTEETVGVKNIITIPHLGASTEESEDNCAVMAAHELMEYLEQGNIRNSVNYPAVSMPVTPGAVRLVILHLNVPNMISHISTTLAEHNINIENLANRSRGDYACSLLDVEEITDAIVDKIMSMDGIIRVIRIG